MRVADGHIKVSLDDMVLAHGAYAPRVVVRVRENAHVSVSFHNELVHGIRHVGVERRVWRWKVGRVAGLLELDAT
jgi:hypothetical protein